MSDMSITVIYHAMSLTALYGIENPCPGWRQAQKCDGVKPINEISTLGNLLGYRPLLHMSA